MDHSLKMRVQFVVGFTNVGIAITNCTFGNGKSTNYLWWWLGHGFSPCYTHTKNFQKLSKKLSNTFKIGPGNSRRPWLYYVSLTEAGWSRLLKAAERMAQELYPNCPDALVFPVGGTELRELGCGLRDVGMKMISIDDSWWLSIYIDDDYWYLK